MKIFEKYSSNCVNLATIYFPPVGSDRLFRFAHATVWVKLVCLALFTSITLKTDHVRTKRQGLFVSVCVYVCVCMRNSWLQYFMWLVFIRLYVKCCIKCLLLAQSADYSLLFMFSAVKFRNVCSMFYILILISEIFLPFWKTLCFWTYLNFISTHNKETTWTFKMTSCYDVSWNSEVNETRYAYRFDVLLVATHACTLNATM
jgi:hypothetical protein